MTNPALDPGRITANPEVTIRLQRNVRIAGNMDVSASIDDFSAKRVSRTTMPNPVKRHVAFGAKMDSYLFILVEKSYATASFTGPCGSR